MRSIVLAACAAAGLGGLVPAAPAQAQAEPLIGQLMTVGFNFCPRGWARADGQLLAIQDNTALYSLLGTTYGGDGRTTFALPDLRGRVAVHSGSPPAGQTYPLGAVGGAETVTLGSDQMPRHTHRGRIIGTAAGANTGSAADGVPASGGGASRYAQGVQADTPMGAGTVRTGPAGGDAAFDNRSPFVVLNTCIALTGIYPSRQ